MLSTVHFLPSVTREIIIGNKLYQGHCIVGEISIGIQCLLVSEKNVPKINIMGIWLTISP